MENVNWNDFYDNDKAKMNFNLFAWQAPSFEKMMNELKRMSGIEDDGQVLLMAIQMAYGNFKAKEREDNQE